MSAAFEFDARYIKETTPNGDKYTFFCDLSGAVVHTTDPICAVGEEAALALAKRESRDYFNRCRQCGKWIGDTVYNIDEAKCVECAPFDMAPHYCTECGGPLKENAETCAGCGARVKYTILK
jgi:hypothetical protein